MERFKKAIKTLFIIIAFLFANVIIDVFTGATIPSIIAGIKDGDILKSSDYLVYGLFVGQLIKLTLLYFYIGKRDKTYRNQLDRPYILNNRIINPIQLLGIGLGTVGFGQIFVNIIMKIFAGTDQLSSAMKLLEKAFSPKGPLDGVIILVVVAIGAPLVEELLFRGVLFEEIKRECSLKTTIFLTALIFGFYHFNIIQSPNTFFMGLVLAYVYYKTKSIKCSIIVHATNNILAMIPFLDQGLSPIGLAIYGTFLIIGIYSIITLKRNA